MSENDWKKRLGMVYSTNPDFEYDTVGGEEERSPEPGKQDLRVWLDRKHRAGKQATVIRGFVGNADDLKALASFLKGKCGVGGSAKDGEIIIQGDFRDRIVDILSKEGYKVKKAGG